MMPLLADLRRITASGCHIQRRASSAGSWTAHSSSLAFANGNQFRFRITASSTLGATNGCTISIQGTSTTIPWSVTTATGGGMPEEPIVFEPVVDAQPGITYETEPYTVSGLVGHVRASAAGNATSMSLRRNGGSLPNNSWVTNGDQITIRAQVPDRAGRLVSDRPRARRSIRRLRNNRNPKPAGAMRG